MNAELPLVSIIVITYNSAKYVLETLESAKAQTYQNIELIISDDGSTDKTIETCENWLAENKERFVYSQIITVEKNTGIPANCNRGVKASKGEWLKLIAGDDILLESNIDDNIRYANVSGEKIFISDLISFGIGKKFKLNLDKFQRKFLNSKAQYKFYLRYPLFLNIPTLFFKKDIYDEVGGFFEQIKLLEDQPFILMVLQKGHKIGYHAKHTVMYRINQESVSSNSGLKITDQLIMSFNIFRKSALLNGNIKDKIFYIGAKYEFYFKQNPNKLIGKKNFDRIYRVLLNFL